MSNPFITTVKASIAELQAAQAKHDRLKSRADARLAVARSRHEAEIDAAVRVEADAWRSLLSIPGVTPATVAALLQVHETTVARWAARAPRSASTVAKRDLARGVKQRDSSATPGYSAVSSPEEPDALGQWASGAGAVQTRFEVAGVPAESSRDPRR
jgi:hypothetical protein